MNKVSFLLMTVLVVGLMLPACNSPEQNNLQEFRRVDASLSQSPVVVDSVEYFHDLLGKANLRPTERVRLDSLGASLMKARHNIDALKLRLASIAISQVKHARNRQGIQTTPEFLQLKKAVETIHALSSIEDEHLKESMVIMTSKDNGKLRYLDEVPIVAASTMLTKIGNDCNQAVFREMRSVLNARAASQ